MAGGIALLAAGLFVLWAGISALRSASGAGMPLLLKGLFQSTSKGLGTAFVVVGGFLVVVGVVLIVQGIAVRS